MSETAPPPVGSIRLLDAVQPSLTTGLYRLQSTLAMRDVSHGVNLPAPAPHQGHFAVMGSRFALPPGAVSNCQPADKTRGYCDDILPHVVLSERARPWECTLTDGTPALALLVFRSDEAKIETGTVRTSLPSDVVTRLDQQAPIDGDPSITVLRVHSAATFRSVLPTHRDLTLLTHVRQVNLRDGALAGQDDDGWFAVVVANRLPLREAGAQAGTNYVAALVSLEQREELWSWPDGQPPPALIVLHSWTFTSAASGGSFEHAARSLALAPAGSAVTLTRTSRAGDTRSVRYRSPLVGLGRGQAPDPTLPDATLEVARALGRVAAAADGRFVREIVRWHREEEERARSQMIDSEVRTLLGPVARSLTATGAPRSLAVRLADRFVAQRSKDSHAPRLHPAARKQEGEPR